MKTLYQVLGVRRKASLDEIEQRYREHLNRHIASPTGRRLRRKDQLRLQAIRGAFLILSSPSRRSRYDEELARQEQRRNRLLDAGGAILAVSALLIGLLFLGSGSWLRREPAAPDKAPKADLLAAGKTVSSSPQAAPAR